MAKLIFGESDRGEIAISDIVSHGQALASGPNAT
jgi:hypothetical protein